MVIGSSICQRTWIPPDASASVSPRILRRCRSREGRVSCSRRIPKICSPVNLDRFIRPSLPRGGPQEPLAEYQEVRSEPSDLTRKSRSHSKSGPRLREDIRYSFPVHRETQPSRRPPETRPLPGPNRPSNPAPRDVSTDGSGANRTAGSATWRNRSAQAGMSEGWVAVGAGERQLVSAFSRPGAV